MEEIRESPVVVGAAGGGHVRWHLFLVGLTALAVLLAVVTTVNWWGKTVGPVIGDRAKKIESDFQADNSSADSAPKQQVVAAWAIKDASVTSLVGQSSLIQHEIYIERRLETLAILQVGLILAVLALVLRPSGRSRGSA